MLFDFVIVIFSVQFNRADAFKQEVDERSSGFRFSSSGQSLPLRYSLQQSRHLEEILKFCFFSLASPRAAVFLVELDFFPCKTLFYVSNSWVIVTCCHFPTSIIWIVSSQVFAALAFKYKSIVAIFTSYRFAAVMMIFFFRLRLHFLTTERRAAMRWCPRWCHRCRCPAFHSPLRICCLWMERWPYGMGSSRGWLPPSTHTLCISINVQTF